MERDYDRRWGDDRHKERFDERGNSPDVSGTAIPCIHLQQRNTF